MKKLLFCLIFSLAFLPAVFAIDNYEINDSSEKTFGISSGVRFSVLGVEPTFAIDVYNLEVEAACAISSGLNGKHFGYAPSFSVAYNTNPFERGSAAVFGAEYMYLAPSYTNMLPKSFDDYEEGDVLPAVHAVSLFYKGAYNFNKAFGLLWRIRLPVFIGARDGEDLYNFNITNLPGFTACALIGFCTTSVGVKFVF